jgi:uroporphyrinogen decarboxylase
MLQPVEAFEVDAAILFSDILVLVEAMGMDLAFDDRAGPVLSNPVRTSHEALSLKVPDPEDELGYVMKAIRLSQKALGGRVPLIGFSGAPFTLATYIVEGGSSRDFLHIKSLMYQDYRTFHKLMETLVEATNLYLNAQVAAGAQALQVFDTWAVVLSPTDYEEYVLPHMKRLMEELRSVKVPVIHFSLGASTLLDHLKASGGDVISLDWKIDIGDARTRLGPRVPVQGNLDPLALFQPHDRFRNTILGIMERATRWPGYIFNLGHGIHPATPVESVERLIETVHSFSIETEEASFP